MGTAVQDRSTIDLAALKAWQPEITTADHDTELQIALDAAKEVADDYLGNDFEASDGTEEAIPKAVEIGVVRMARELWGGEDGPTKDGVIQERAGDLQRSYSVTLLADLPRSVTKLWDRYRLIPGF